MSNYLEFKRVRCKDCYKCLRECPVKAIDVQDHQAKIMEDRCILCGHCTLVCPQNAKMVHSEIDRVQSLMASGERVVASVAPSFVSSLGVMDFGVMRLALARMGFQVAEETAVGARAVTAEYRRLLERGQMKNFITSACPAACSLIQKYYPKALPYLAPVDSPMLAHAKMLRKSYPGCKVVFIGPCIAKKREAAESCLVDAVLTFEDLMVMLEQHGIDLTAISSLHIGQGNGNLNRAKIYPVSRGIIRSFDALPEGYQYMSVDGTERCMEVLENIEALDHAFIEINICSDACINGPCKIVTPGGIMKAESDLNRYLELELASGKGTSAAGEAADVDLHREYPRLRDHVHPVSDKDIEAVLHRTGKFKPEDELNCGACGYSTCREKAAAVVNGFADIEICLPYMRKRAESLAVEVVRNSPDGVILVDSEMDIVDVNATAMKLLGMGGSPDNFQKRAVSDFFPSFEFYSAYTGKRNVPKTRMHVGTTGRYVDLSITYLAEQNLLFGLMKDVTEEVDYDKRLEKMTADTLATTDDVIMKQMRVAQEIASLLGETTAETKVALLNLKKMLQTASSAPKEDK